MGLWIESEVQFHLPEGKPAEVNAQGEPDDGNQNGPELEGILNGIGNGQIDGPVIEEAGQLQLLQEFGAQRGELMHQNGGNAGDQNDVADQAQNHVLGAENQRHQQGDGTGDQQNGAKTGGQKEAKLLKIQIDAGNDRQKAQHTTGDQKVGEHNQCQLDQLGNDNLQTGNTKAESHLNGLGTEVKGEGLVEEYKTNGITYYLFDNNEQVQAAWIVDSYECGITGKVTIDELKLMINSIGKG